VAHGNPAISGGIWMKALTLTFFESQRKTDKKFFSLGLASLVIHTAVISGTFFATRGVIRGDYTVRADTTVVLLTPAQKAPEPMTLDVPLKGFQTVVVPAVTPADIPPVNLRERFDPADYTGRGVEGGSASGATIPNQLFSEAFVEEKPLLLSAPPLTYPEGLRREGIEGHVVVQAVVDTTGRVEPGSIKIVKSSNAAFDLPTRLWVLKALFRPARLHGEAVRVLISQPVDYYFAAARSRG
jgi:TonB family protein